MTSTNDGAPLHLTREDNFMISWSAELAKLKRAHAEYENSGMSPEKIRERISSNWVCFVCWSSGHFPGRDCPRVRELEQRGMIQKDAPLDNLFAGNETFKGADGDCGEATVLNSSQIKKSKADTSTLI